MRDGISLGLLVVFSTLCVLSIVFIPLFFVNTGATRGTHTGYVTAIEHNDNLLWDADLMYFKTDTESTQEDIYCLKSPISSDFAVAQHEKIRVTISYYTPFWFMRWDCNGGIAIVDQIVISEQVEGKNEFSI